MEFDTFIDESVSNIDKILAHLPSQYHEYILVFSSQLANLFPGHRKLHINIDTQVDKKMPWKPIYPLSNSELKEFWEHLANHHAGGTYSLALMLRAGEGCEQNEKRAFELFKTLAEAEIPAAMHTLGTMLSRGEGCVKDEITAAHWFSQGSAHGDPLSTYALATFTCSGKGGISQDWAEGFRLHTLAARSGMPYALFNLGCHYFSGQGVCQDMKEAVYWWQLAADKNVPEAMLNLGKMYAQGLGVELDKEIALQWYFRAVGESECDASTREALKVLLEEMDSVKLSETIP